MTAKVTFLFAVILWVAFWGNLTVSSKSISIEFHHVDHFSSDDGWSNDAPIRQKRATVEDLDQHVDSHTREKRNAGGEKAKKGKLNNSPPLPTSADDLREMKLKEEEAQLKKEEEGDAKRTTTLIVILVVSVLKIIIIAICCVKCFQGCCGMASSAKKAVLQNTVGAYVPGVRVDEQGNMERYQPTAEELGAVADGVGEIAGMTGKLGKAGRMSRPDPFSRRGAKAGGRGGGFVGRKHDFSRRGRGKGHRGQRRGGTGLTRGRKR